MVRSPQERLERLARHVREGWRLVQDRPGVRDRARRWLEMHPSARPDIDRLWLEALDGTGPLATWLAAGGVLTEWPGSPALHGVLASHPFPDLLQWSILPKSLTS